ncbi:lipopolysaccharide biosynthesis protein [Pseudonocardia sp. RS010]|uniref:lipopolysaccharide biosynthesis protein n=1 Tax=Pseudonocardia sp. RS010 TaxID=3385979 RepID=UPI0039A2E1EC
MRSTLNLGLALGVFGVAGYVFVGVVGHTFADDALAASLGALTSFYFLTNIIGPGLFGAIEPETSRAVSASIALGRPIGPAVGRSVRVAVLLLLGFVVVTVGLWPVMLSRVLAGDLGLLFALLVGGVGAAAVYVVRGVLSGTQAYGRYAATFYLEGGLRLVVFSAFLAWGVAEPDAFGFAFSLATVVAAAALIPALPRDRSSTAGDDASGADQIGRMGRSTVQLAVAAVLVQLIANIGPVVVTYRMPDQLLEAGSFGTAFILARIPLVLFSPIQALLVPRLSAAAAAGDLALVRTRITQAVLVVLAVGLPVVALGTAVGPWFVRVVFNAAAPPQRIVFGLLAVSAVLIMLALVLQPALVALRQQGTVTLAWVVGSVLCVGLLFAPLDPMAAALVGQLVGPGAVLAINAFRLRSIFRAGDGRQPAPQAVSR